MAEFTFKAILTAKLAAEFHNGMFIEVHSSDLPKIMEIVEETHNEFKEKLTEEK